MSKKPLRETRAQKRIREIDEKNKLEFLGTIKSVLKDSDRLWKITAIELPRKLRFKKDIYLLAQAQFRMTQSDKYLKKLYERVDKHPEILKI